MIFCAALLALSCIHSPALGENNGPLDAADNFWKRARWRDWSGAALLVIPERRSRFTKSRELQGDEKDLTLTDYELLDAKVAPSGKSAQVTAKVGWVRLPSVSERTDIVNSLMVKMGEVWLMAQQDTGPFAPELKQPYSIPETH